MPNENLDKIKEFLGRKGPAGIPYWGLGAMGVAVIAGTIWLQRSGGLGALTGGGTAPTAQGETGGGGSGAGGVPPDITPPATFPPGPSGAPPPEPAAPAAPPPPSQPPLIGQQEGTTSGGLSSPPPPSPVDYAAIAAWAPVGGPNISRRSYAAATPPTASSVPFAAAQQALANPAARTSVPFAAAQQALATPVPVTQTQIVQYQAPGSRRGGPQAL